MERGSALQLERLARMMRQDVDRMVKRRILAPPAPPGLVPGPGAAAEHVAAHDRRTCAGQDVLAEPRARVHLAAFLAVALAERLQRDQPAVELLASDAEWILRRLARTGDEPVDRHRDVQLQLGHAPKTAGTVNTHRRACFPYLGTGLCSRA